MYSRAREVDSRFFHLLWSCWQFEELFLATRLSSCTLLRRCHRSFLWRKWERRSQETFVWVDAFLIYQYCVNLDQDHVSWDRREQNSACKEERQLEWSDFADCQWFLWQSSDLLFADSDDMNILDSASWARSELNELSEL